MWNQLKTLLLLAGLTGLMLGVGQILGGRSGLTIALLFALIMNFGMYFFSDKIVLRMYKAKEASKKDHAKLHTLIEKLVKKADIPKPKVYIIPTQNPNAFATGRNPNNAVIACTEGILEILDDEELEGVLAHELGHVKNRDMLVTTIASTIAGVISYVAVMARWGALFGGRDNDSGNLFAIIALSILTPLIALILQLAISRSREYMADKASAAITKKPLALANALRKLEKGAKMIPMKGNNATSSLFIVNPFRRQAIMALLSTHPATEERIRRLEKMD